MRSPRWPWPSFTLRSWCSRVTQQTEPQTLHGGLRPPRSQDRRRLKETRSQASDWCEFIFCSLTLLAPHLKVPNWGLAATATKNVIYSTVLKIDVLSLNNKHSYNGTSGIENRQNEHSLNLITLYFWMFLCCVTMVFDCCYITRTLDLFLFRNWRRGLGWTVESW